ncbi:MAG: 2',3'-cyclic-nucleotide 2'-phosphodiesterase (5'-nucleotidase family) [Myxococcota bacterium]|jgi:2',3'-cyclic-nucleotide 2'-phosphodiesterase (5'-nucleotidase family)
MSRFVLSLAVLFAVSARADREIVILHTSDVHGAYSSRPSRSHGEPGRRIGGFAVLANLAKSEKRPKILLDSGDLFQGTPEGNLTLGEASITLMNHLGYAAMAIGNHEYDFGEPNLRKLAALARFPMLGANIFRRRDGKRVEYAHARTMVEVGGVKVGIVGVATRKTATSTLPAHVAHLRFGPEAASTKHQAEVLRKKGAHIVVALTHCGLAPSVARTRVDADSFELKPIDTRYGGDLSIARAGGVDVVLGGHMHTGFSKAWRDPVSGVPIVQSYQNLEAASRVVVTLDDSGKPRTITAELVDLWVDEYGEDPAVLALLEGFRSKVGKALDVQIAVAGPGLVRGREKADSALGNWLTDVMRASAGTQIALQNTRGIRADLHEGPLTMRDVYKVMPFDNTLVTTTLTGDQLRTLIRASLKGGAAQLQISGMTVSAWLDAEGHPTKVRVKVAGTPLKGKQRYTVATNNYLASGGTGGEIFQKIPTKDTAKNIRDLFIEAAKSRAHITAPKTGRITIHHSLAETKP